MLSDDVYKSRLRATIAAIESWLDGLRPWAAIEIARDEASWRAAVHPNVPEGCPFEVVLRADQRFDLSVDGEIHEDQTIDSLERIEPLLVAIAAGNVVTSSWATAATAMPVLVATRIFPADGHRWIRSRKIGTAGSDGETHLIRHDRHYVPYARGA
jgi:hypothetical protein